MSIIKRSEFPFGRSLLSDFFNSDRLFDTDFFNRNAGVSTPAVNVAENDNHFALEIAAPGMQKDDLTIKVENGILTVSGEKKQEEESRENEYTRKEFSYQSFARSFSLPESIEEDQISGNYKDGILTLTLPKKAHALANNNARQIDIG